MSTSGVGALTPSSPVVNQGNLYITGMNLSYTSVTTFTVAAGQCRDQSNVCDILMGATLFPGVGAGGTNSLSNSAAVVGSVSFQGAGGLDVGTVAASTFYYVYAIGDSRGFKNGSVVLSLSVAGPSLPLGYDSYRCIGGVATNGSSQVRQFVQVGSGLSRTMYYDVPVAPGTAATAGTTTFATIGTLVTLVPQKAVQAIVGSSLTANAAGDALFLAPFGAAGNTSIYDKISSVATTVAQQANLTVPVGFNAGVATVNYRTTSASDTVAFVIQGYIDQL